MINPLVVFLAAVVQLIIFLWALYQLGAIAHSTRATEENSAKTVLLLTVIANHQGATAADVEKALGKDQQQVKELVKSGK